MLRSVFCALVGLVLCAGVGLSADKGGKKAGVHGHFQSYADHTLTIKSKKEEKTFTLTDTTPVTVWSGDNKTTGTAKDAFKDVAVGTAVVVTSDDAGTVTGVTVGKKPKKDK